jgi:branched-subunit amino acid transport protein AzlD
MTLSILQTIVIIIMVMIATMLTRFLPFLLLKFKGSNNKSIHYLGKVLPYSAIGLLVVYCLKDISFVSTTDWLPEAIAILCIVVLHIWKNNVLLSIGAGTVVYMILVQTVFVS